MNAEFVLRSSSTAWLPASLRVAFAAGAVAATALAQPQFDLAIDRHLPSTATDTTALAATDIDGDGDRDLLLASAHLQDPSSRQNRLYRNDGQGHFEDVTATHLPADQDETFAVAAGDVDGDGDADVVFGNGDFLSQQNRLYRNDGSGLFTDVTATHLPNGIDRTAGVALGDVDGDGDLDLVVGNDAEQNRLLLNDGTGRFVDATSTHLPPVLDRCDCVLLVDVDGDGDLDLLVGGQALAGRGTRLYLNDGTGTFTDVTSTQLPADASPTVALVSGDVDGDGDADLLLAHYGQDGFYRNDGTGRFTDASVNLPTDAATTRALALIDVDSDADLDLARATLDGPGLYANDGAGKFTDATSAWMPATAAAPTIALAAEDLDGDADPDLVLGTVGDTTDGLLLNDGTGRLIDAAEGWLPARGDSTAAFGIGDLNGDGNLDLVIGVALTCGQGCVGQDRVLLHDGGDRLVDVTAQSMPKTVTNTSGLALADFDRDGDLDVVTVAFLDTTISSGPSQLLRNDGSGTFTAAASALPAKGLLATTAVDYGDVDGDGDVDLVLGNGWDGLQAQTDLLYLNDGTGRFTDATLGRVPYDKDRAGDTCLFDADGDGDLDWLIANVGTRARLYRNDGTGHYVDVTATHLPPDTASSSACAVGDVDGDGDLDIVLANIGQNALYLNDGTGRFTDATSRLPPSLDSTAAVVLDDLDADGDLDLFLANSGYGPAGQNRLYANDGTGRFTDVTSTGLPVAGGLSSAAAVADLDMDGDPDLIVGAISAPDRVFVGLHRHLLTPYLLMPGREFRLELFSRHGTAGTTDVGFPYLALGPARLPVPPFGVLRLDPTTVVSLPLLAIPSATGSASVAFHVPNDPRVVGLAVYAQALIAQLPGVVRLSNVTVDTGR